MLTPSRGIVRSPSIFFGARLSGAVIYILNIFHALLIIELSTDTTTGTSDTAQFRSVRICDLAARHGPQRRPREDEGAFAAERERDPALAAGTGALDGYDPSHSVARVHDRYA